MEYLLKASAALVLFYLCFYIFLKKETFFQQNRWFLLTGLIIALIFPIVVIPVYIAVEPIVIPEPVMYFENVATPYNTSIAETTFDWTSLFPIIYGIGCTLFFIQFLLQFGSLAMLLLKHPKYRDGFFTYVIVENKISPFSFFKWIVYNPDSFEPNELDLILTHEKVHAKQLHSVDILLTQLACVIFWFNPLIWLYKKEVRQNLEYIADLKTQAISEDEKVYQHLLLKTSVTNHSISLTNNFYNSLIKERIVMLQKSRSKRKKQWRYLLILPLLGGLLMSMNTEKIYIETTENTLEVPKETVEFLVTKSTSNSELKNMASALKQKGSTLVFSNIERNSNNEITNITVKLSESTYQSSSDSAIESFIVYKEFFEDQGGFIGRYGNGTIQLDTVIGEPKDNPRIKQFTDRVNTTLVKYNLMDKAVKNQNAKDTNTIKIVFNNKMNDKQLDEIKNELKSNGITMTIRKLKRNKAGLITAINLDFKTENRSTNYSIKDDEGIEPFYFHRKENGSFGVGAVNNQKHIIKKIVVDDSTKSKKRYKYRISGGTKNIKIMDSSDYLIRFSESNAFVFDDKKGRTGLAERQNLNSIMIDSVYDINKLFFERDTIHISNNFSIDSAEVKRLSKLNSHIYYEDGKPVKILHYRESDNLHNPKVNNSNYSYYDTDSKEPLVIIDGKIGDKIIMKTVNPDNIESINVIKGNSATKLYGDKGKNGVIVIKSKDKNIWFTDTKKKDNSPYRVEVTSTSYRDDDNPNKNGTLAYITKYTPDKVLEDHKNNLKKIGIIVKYSKLRRNQLGEITSIKISLKKDNKGSSSSATWKVDDGIPGIEFGETEGSLIARTSEMNKH